MSERKVVLITGAARGIGAATAREFASRGYDVAMTDVLADELGAAAVDVRAAGARIFAQACDLADLGAAEAWAGAAIKTLGRVDVLVNNAAWRELCTMREIGIESWERTLRICLTAPAFLARRVAQDMEVRRSGVIINVSSVMSQRASGIAPAYVAAKSGLDALTYDLAALYGPAGIRVVGVNPGAVDTDMSNDIAGDAAQLAADVRDYSQQMIPLGRWGRAEEIARTIAMLASEDASYITGTSVVVDGGWSHQWQPTGLKRRTNPGQFP